MPTSELVPESMQVNSCPIHMPLEGGSQEQNGETFSVSHGFDSSLRIKEIRDAEILLEDPTPGDVRVDLISVAQGHDHESRPSCFHFLVHQDQKVLGNPPSFLPSVIGRLFVDNLVQADLGQSGGLGEILTLARPLDTLKGLPAGLQTAQHAGMVQSGVVQSGDGSLSGLVPVQEAVVQDQVFTLMH